MVVILVHAITELLFTYITSVILAVISADGELLFANVTHMVTILISALAKCLFTDIALVIAILVQALGERLFTYVTLMVGICIRAFGSYAADIAGVIAVKILAEVEDIAIHTFTDKDVVRHKLVQQIIRAYEKFEKDAAERAAQRRAASDRKKQVKNDKS